MNEKKKNKEKAFDEQVNVYKIISISLMKSQMRVRIHCQV